MSDEIAPFLMVVTEVDEELQETTLHTVYDGEPPGQMKWWYGTDIPCHAIGDQVGDCYRVTIEKLPRA